MHQGNRDFLDFIREQWSHVMERGAVLEIGSLDVNGSVRPWFVQPDYTGVDKVDGPGVDTVCDFVSQCGGAVFERSYDVIVCFSVLEHEPRWQRLLATAISLLAPGGALLLSWGAEGNKHHAPEPWAPVPHLRVLDELKRAGLEVMFSAPEGSCFTPDCEGCWDVVAFKP